MSYMGVSAALLGGMLASALVLLGMSRVRWPRPRRDDRLEES